MKVAYAPAPKGGATKHCDSNIPLGRMDANEGIEGVEDQGARYRFIHLRSIEHSDVQGWRCPVA